MKQNSRLAEAANRTWAIAGKIHDRQTARGGNVNGRIHVEMVEDNIWRLLYETHDRSRKLNSENFSAVDLYLLSCAACCHDFDKGLHNSVLLEDFKHGEGSGDFVFRNWQALGIESEAAAEYIDSIVRIHDFKEDFDERVREIPESYTLFNTTGDLQRLAILLKAADTLHVDESRVCTLAVPDDSLSGFDRLKQIARGSIHGWRSDGERIIITGSIKSRDTAEALFSCEKYIKRKEWPPIDRNLRSCGFPHKIYFEWRYPPSLRDQLIREGILLPDGSHFDFERITSEMIPAKSLTAASLVSDELLRIGAVPPDKLAEYLAEAGPLSVIDNAYIQPELTELGAAPGAVNRIFVGPADCGKTRAAYEWIRCKVGLDTHAWCILRPESGSIPQDASKFIIDFDRYYDLCGRLRPHKAILFVDDLPDYLPPLGGSPAASEHVHRLLEWLRQYPGFQERSFVGTVRFERTHDKPDWPNRLAELGRLRLLRVEPLNVDQRRDLWKGMSRGRSFRDQIFQKLNVEIEESFLEAVAPLEADPEAISYYIRAMAEQGKKRIVQEDAASFSTDVAKIWTDLTWPTIFETYGTAACVFFTLARFIEAGVRPYSGFRVSLTPAWEYHAAFGPALLAENGGTADNYLLDVKHMLGDGHASGIDGEWVRPRFDFLLQAQEFHKVELPLPRSSWFARHIDGLSPFGQTSIAFHFSCANQPCRDETVSVHWLLGNAYAMEYLACQDADVATKWHEQSLLVYDDLLSRFEGDLTPGVREQVALGLYNKGKVLVRLDREAEAVEACDALLHRFGNDPTPEVKEHLIRGMVLKAAILAMGRDERAVEVCNDILQRFADDGSPDLQGQVAKALVLKAAVLGDRGRNEETVEACDALLIQFGGDRTPDVQEHVAKALVLKAAILGDLGRNEEAMEAYDDLLRRFGDDRTPDVQEQVANALVNKGMALGRLGRYEEAVEAYDDLLRRFGDDWTPDVQEQVAQALFYKGVALASLSRFDDALVPLDDLVDGFGDNPIPRVRKFVATGLVLKGRILGRRGRHDEAVAAFEELQRLFGKDQELSVAEQVATGLYYSTSNYIGMWHSSKDQELLDKAISNGRQAVFLGEGCYNLACALARAGQLNEAFELLKVALENGEIPWAHVAQDPDWESLRDDPWYKGLETKYGAESYDSGEAPPQKS